MSDHFHARDDFRIMTPAELDLACPMAAVLFDRDLAERIPRPFFCMSPVSWEIADLAWVNARGRPIDEVLNGYLYVGSATNGKVVWCWDDEAMRWDDLSGGEWCFPWQHAWERSMEIARGERI